MKVGGRGDKLLGYLEGTEAKDKMGKPKGQEGYAIFSVDVVGWGMMIFDESTKTRV